MAIENYQDSHTSEEVSAVLTATVVPRKSIQYSFI